MINKRCDWFGEDPIYVEYHDKKQRIPILMILNYFEF